MGSHYALSILLALSLTLLSVASQDTMYRMRMPNFSGTGATGGSGSTGASGGYSSGPSSSGPTGASGGGRIVGNSLLDLDEPSSMEVENIHTGYRQQPSGISPAMTRPVITGPSVVTGQVLVADNGINSMTMEDRLRGSNPTPPSQMQSNNRNSNANDMQDRKVHRYISVHVPPPEPMLPPRPRPSQPLQKPETHYQIVFIKAPSPNPQELQEIQLPPPPQMKTMVYVLLKKPEMKDFVKISQQPKVKPSKPEVFFIQYKGQKPQLQSPTGSMMMMMNSASNSGNGNNNADNNNQNSRSRTTSTTEAPPSPDEITQNLGGYDNSELADSDFSHDSFNENEFSLSSYQRHNSNRQQLLRSGFSYSPAASQYGITT